MILIRLYRKMDEVYANEIAKRAVARACVALGFKNCQESALESLSDILKQYIHTIGLASRDQAEVSGRVAVGIQDLILAIEVPKPNGTSWKELRSFINAQDSAVENSEIRWNQPFPFDVPRFPADSLSTWKNSEFNDSTSTRDPYVPSHLPPYPPAHTYKRSAGKKRLLSEASKNSSSATADKVDSNKRISAVRSAQQSLAMIEDSLDC